MTREEAFDGIYHADTFDLAQDMVNKIYDDFESRTCENCKHYEEIIQGIGECSNDIYEGFSAGLVYDYDNMFLPKDFGCNKWESK